VTSIKSRSPRSALPRVWHSLVWYAGGETASKLGVLTTTVIAAHAVDAVQFGLFIGLSATVALATAVWDAGSSVVVTREVAAGRLSLRRAAQEALRLRAVTVALWCAAFALGLLALRDVGFSPFEVAAFAGASLLAGLRAVVFALLQAHTRFAAAGLALSSGRWLTAASALAVFAVENDDRLLVLGLAMVAGEAMALAIAIGATLRLPNRSTGPGIRSVTFRASLPFAMTTLLALTYNRLDVLIVSALSSAAQLSAYAPASRIQDALYLLPTAIGAITLPMVSSEWRAGQGSERVARLIWHITAIGLTIALPVAALTCIFAPAIVDLVLGGQYSAATLPTRIIVWFLPLAVITAGPLAGLAAIGRGRETVVVFGAAFATALALHVALVPSFGATGGAVASLARDPVAVLLTLVFAHRVGILGHGGKAAPGSANVKAAQ
jgi:O-antigen/teichoic acid export membrane protein